jgi:hypothetical protein
MSRYDSDPRVSDAGSGVIQVRGTARTVEVESMSQHGAWRIIRPDAAADDFRQERDLAIDRALELAS